MHLKVLHHHGFELSLILDKTYNLIHQLIVKLLGCADLIESMFVTVSDIRVGNGLLDKRIDECIC